MRISCQSFSLPKAGRNFIDCEDAYFPGELNNLQVYEVSHDQSDIFRASVSDGATDSIFSKLWAQLLAFGYGAGKWTSDISAQSILEEQSAWLDFLGKQQLPWYAEEKAELGAFAAMVGLTLLNDSKKWNALAVGDCCIFHIRNAACIKSFPITNSAAFSNFPMLLCSVADRNTNVFESKQIIADGTWQSGDQFFLMSDTVACWFLSQMETGNTRETIAALADAQSLEAFVSIVDHARTTKGADGNVLMRDDDVTFTIVQVADDADPPLPQKIVFGARSATSRPAVELPKIGAGETQHKPDPENIVENKNRVEPKNKAELPHIPKQNIVAAASPSHAPGTNRGLSSSAGPGPNSGLSPNSSLGVSPGPNPSSNPSSNPSPSPASNSTSTSNGSAPTLKSFALYPKDDTSGSGGVVKESDNAERRYASKSRAKSSKLAPGIFVIATIAVGVLVISAASFFSHSNEKHVKAEHETVSEPAQPSAKAEEVSTKQLGGHHRLKHKVKKLHPVAIAPSGAPHPSDSDAAQNTYPPTAPAPNSIPGDSSPVDLKPAQSPGSQPTQIVPQTRSPQPAPERNAAKHSGQSMDRSLDRMPPEAPDRNHMPLPAPDRNGGTPVQMPDHVRQGRGFDRVHSSTDGHQHNRTGSPSAKPVGPGREKNDMPENLNF